jgi:hypothetical protein
MPRLTQSNPDQLFSNRLNGIAIGILSWTLTVVMWRNITTITHQQRQLSKVNVKLQARRQGGVTSLLLLTWTISSTSTTPTAIRLAMPCCATWRG